MDFSRFFIDRPIFAAVLSILIFITGLIAIPLLPVSEYPDVVPPSVQVRAEYPGANPKVIAETVATPLEEAINGVENMMYMKSVAGSDGVLVTTVTFRPGTDPDQAQVQVQNRVAQAEARLPEDVRRLGITTQKQSPTLTLVVHLFSPNGKYDSLYMRNYATLKVKDELARLPGVGQIQIFGSGEYAMRVWLDPNKVAARGLTASDVVTAMQEQNVQVSAGQLGAEPLPQESDFLISINAQGRLHTEEEFGNIILKTAQDGSLVRLRDVARIEMGSGSYALRSQLNNKDAVGIGIFQSPGANAIDLSNAVRAKMAELATRFPEDMQWAAPYDPTVFVRDSIRAVVQTLLEAVVLVVLVVILFLQTWRASIIPLIAVPVSVVGTFSILYLLGFSLNTLSLFGLVLAIGIVVDDAIVVVENVDRIMRRDHLTPLEATRKAMQGLNGALIAMSLVLCAVFVPVSFLGGISGSLYRQFTVTIVVSVVISTIVALTLSPVMCSLVLRQPRRGHKPARIFRLINYWLAKGNRFYSRIASRSMLNPRLMVSTFGILLVGIFLMHRLVPQSFMPQEDQGYFTVELELPEGASLERTREVTDRAMAFLKDDPDVAHVLNVVGTSPRMGTNQAHSQLTVILRPWSERDASGSVSAVMSRIRCELSRYPEAKVYLSSPAIIPGLGSSGGFEMVLEARGNATYTDLRQAVDTLMHYASALPQVSGLSSSMQSDIPQFFYDVDRDKARMHGVPLADIFATMKAFTGSVYINDFNMFNRIYRVYIQAEAPYRARRDNLNLYFVRSASGTMIPVTALGETHYTSGPGTIKRFNMFYAATITGEAANGYSSGQAMDALLDVVRTHLPPNIGVEWTGLSYQERHESGKTGIVLSLALLFVFLFLAAQYESWSIPLAVILSLPVAALGAYAGIWALSLENNIYFQIGLVMLIGLVAKNAILIVEFAKTEMERGQKAVAAAITAIRLRFRPIVMTSLAFILGLIPLVLASGPGSASRRGIGTGVFFGMIIAVAAGIVFVPFFFVWVYRLKQRFKRHKKQ